MTYLVYPNGPARTTVVSEFYFRPEALALPGFDPSPTVELWDLISRQDWVVCERAQLGRLVDAPTGPASTRARTACCSTSTSAGGGRWVGRSSADLALSLAGSRRSTSNARSSAGAASPWNAARADDGPAVSSARPSRVVPMAVAGAVVAEARAIRRPASVMPSVYRTSRSPGRISTDWGVRSRRPNTPRAGRRRGSSAARFRGPVRGAASRGRRSRTRTRRCRGPARRRGPSRTGPFVARRRGCGSSAPAPRPGRRRSSAERMIGRRTPSAAPRRCPCRRRPR